LVLVNLTVSGPVASSDEAKLSIKVAAVQAGLRFYSAPDEFREHMGALVRRAAQEQPDLIVLPEDIGTGLLGLGLDAEMLASSSLPDIVAALTQQAEGVSALAAQCLPATTALMLSRAPQVRQVYLETFAALARETSTWIAAGTILLPHDDSTRQVFNTFFLFGPDGQVAGTADKVNLIPLEGAAGLGLTPGDRQSVAPWVTPVATLGPVICADAWDAELVRGLVHSGAQILLCPSANPERWTEGVREDRLRGLYARVRELGVPGVECFAVGSLAQMPFEGRSWIIAPDGQGGVEVLAQAEDAVGETVITATVPLPPSRR